MKTGFFQILFLLVTVIQLHGQVPPATKDTVTSLQITAALADTLQPDTAGKLPDTFRYTGRKYNNLMDDDPVYNPKSKLWIPIVRVSLTNIFNWLAVRYYHKYEWAVISWETWKQNLKGPWVWDKDFFHTNFWGHPHSGNLYFNVARANGYNFWASSAFAAGGSLMWEVFLENELPSINDIQYTTLNGSFLGEAIYRVTTSILDDRKRGFNRIFREVVAGVINPPGAFNRFTNKKMFRVTNQEVYQKEPLTVRVKAGTDKIKNDNSPEKHPVTSLISLRIDYGDPFEIRKRKPFDYFTIRSDFFGVYLRSQSWFMSGTALLHGTSSKKNNTEVLKGIFQHFEYRFTKNYYLSAVGLGAGIMTSTRINPAFNFSSGVQLAGLPVTGSNLFAGKDTVGNPVYSFAGGFKAGIETSLDFKNRVEAGVNGTFYRLYSYDNPGRRSSMGIIIPRLSVKLTPRISVGTEHYFFFNKRVAENTAHWEIPFQQHQLFAEIHFPPKGR